MFLSVFDIFKIGIGPSSSHTVGPMVAATRFLNRLRESESRSFVRVRVSLHGSLAFTGKGHGTDRAIILGLLGERPEIVDPDQVDRLISRVDTEGQIVPDGLPSLAFEPERDLVFNYEQPLPSHSNGMVFQALDATGNLVVQETYYSIGGGFVATADELEQSLSRDSALAPHDVPYPFATAAQMLEMGEASGLSIAEMKRANECTTITATTLDRRLDSIWETMRSCMDRGLQHGGELPGGLKVRRRAGDIHQRLLSKQGYNKPFEHTVVD